jgi:hypothetical protein
VTCRAADLLWFRHRGARQRRLSCCERPARTGEEVYRDSRAERELQSRPKELVQGCGSSHLDQARPLRRVLRSFAGQGDTAGDGAADLSQEDRHHCFDRVEEGSVFRRSTSETTNSLSVFDRIRPIPGIFSGGDRRILETLWFESESQPIT